MRSDPGDRRGIARVRLSEIRAEADQLRTAAWNRVVATAGAGVGIDAAQKCYERFILDLAGWQKPIESAVWRWAYGRAEWLPTSWPPCAYARLRRLVEEADRLRETARQDIKEATS